MGQETQIVADGKVIATIHDPVAFAELLKALEANTVAYHIGRQLAFSAMVYGENANERQKFEQAAESLRDLHRQFGDLRDDLFGTDKQTLFGLKVGS